MHPTNYETFYQDYEMVSHVDQGNNSGFLFIPWLNNKWFQIFSIAKEQARALHQRASMRYFHVRWSPMSLLNKFYKKQEDSGPGLARQQSRPEPNQKFVGGFEKQSV